ncbi:MAG: T9SS type A sorting domain-containing protein [Bacteroidaceae bacterium]|nr:T9SS type A sorting domain-containing protein [Bacteroidaceae bacterium]
MYDLSGKKQRSIKRNLDNSIKLPSGIYIIKEQTRTETKTKKVILP